MPESTRDTTGSCPGCAGPLPPEGPAITFSYVNWNGEEAVRTVVPIAVRLGETEYHPGRQWLLRAWDVEKKAIRDFALSGIRGIEPI